MIKLLPHSLLHVGVNCIYQGSVHEARWKDLNLFRHEQRTCSSTEFQAPFDTCSGLYCSTMALLDILMLGSRVLLSFT